MNAINESSRSNLGPNQVAVLGVSTFINEQLRTLDVPAGQVAAALCIVIGAHIAALPAEDRAAVARACWGIIRSSAGINGQSPSAAPASPQ